MHLDRFGSVFVAKPLVNLRLLRVQAGIPVLMYHSVSEDPEPGVRPYYRLVTSPARFREQMLWLRRHGYSVIGLAEALERVGNGEAETQRSVVITFDDGFRDFLTGAWPVLSDLSMTATVFLPTAFIGARRTSFKGRECLTWDEVRTLHAAGVSFGSHTASHPVLYRLGWNDIRRELRDSRRRIEDELQASTVAFAYPYAFPQEDQDFVARFRSELAGQGYNVGVTTAIGRLMPGHDPLRVRRLPVNEHDDETLFVSKLTGAYDWMGELQAIVRRTKKRVSAMRAS